MTKEEENRIKQIILEVLLDHETLLMEMAIPRKLFKEKIWNLSQQILENWCLIVYCKNNQPDNQNINHWKTELRAHMLSLHRYKLSGNNKLNARMSVFNEVWNQIEYKDPETIYITVSTKFMEEKLPFSREDLKEVSEMCALEGETLVLLMATGNAETIGQYISEL